MHPGSGFWTRGEIKWNCIRLVEGATSRLRTIQERIINIGEGIAGSPSQREKDSPGPGPFIYPGCSSGCIHYSAGTQEAQSANQVIYFKKQEELSDCSCEYIIYTPGWKQNVIPVHTVITPSPGMRQLILFVLPMKFCTQVIQNRDPR